MQLFSKPKFILLPIPCQAPIHTYVPRERQRSVNWFAKQPHDVPIGESQGTPCRPELAFNLIQHCGDACHNSPKVLKGIQKLVCVFSVIVPSTDALPHAAPVGINAPEVINFWRPWAFLLSCRFKISTVVEARHRSGIIKRDLQTRDNVHQEEVPEENLIIWRCDTTS